MSQKAERHYRKIETIQNRYKNFEDKDVAENSEDKIEEGEHT